MKLKGINPLEQHVEKIVLGVFVVAALGMVAFQFLRDTSVKVNNKQIAIAGAYEEAIRDAERLQGRIRSTDLPPGLPEETPNLVAAIQEQLVQPVAPEGPLASSLGFLSAGLNGEIIEGGAATAEYAPLVPPAPVDPIARSYAAALDPVAVAQSPELQALVPKEQPYDIRAVSVQATFPAADLVAWLDSDPDGPGPQEAYPKFLWINRLAILDVQLERQELLPSGEYSDPVAVAPTPGLQQATRDALAADIPSAAVYRSIVAQAREGRTAIVRPPFLPQIAGEAWSPPSAQPMAVVQPGAGTDASELNRLRGVLETKRRELEQVEEDLRAPASSGSSSDRKSTRAQPIGPGGGGGGGNRDRGPSPEERRREILNQRKIKLESEIKQLETIVGGSQVVQDTETVDLMTQPLPMLDAGEDLVLWAHDLTAKPGATYRYRVRALVSNPLFGDRSYPDAPPVVVGEYSDWTAPVQVAPQTMVFFTSAQGGIGGQAGPESVGAAAEVYYFFYGYWRKANVRISPGDAIATTVEAPALPLFTMNGAVAEEAGTTPTELAIDTGGFLVDVVEASSEAAFGQRKTRWHVVYRDENGRLVSRLPEEDRVAPARLQAEAAAAAGLTGAIGVPGAGQAAEEGRRERSEPAPASKPGGRLD